MGYLGNQITTVFPTSISVDTATISSDVNISDKIVHDGDTNTAIRFPSADTVSFETGGSERARVDSNGSILVGTTSNDSANVGARMKSTGRVDATSDGGVASIMTRLSSDGDIMSFKLGSNTIGALASYADRLIIGSFDTALKFDAGNDSIMPFNIGTGANRDNAVDLGFVDVRFDDIRATNGTIQTSDRNDKQDIEELSDAEKRVAVVAKGLMRKYRWKDKVAEKGDKARTHFGIIAQDLEDAFKAEGLDASKYAMFCSDTWWYIDEKYTDDNGKEQTRTITYYEEKEAPEDAIKKTRLGVRYSELLAFIISAL